MATWTTLLLTALLACGDKDGGDDTGPGDGGADGGADGGTDGGGGDGGTQVVDQDSDGYPRGNDCDDDNPDVHPGADEVCNDIDDDCDGVTDQDALDRITLYADADEDGYGNPLSTLTACPGDLPPGYVTDNQDCRDSDPAVNPTGDEVCDDANLDEDCDGLREDDDDSTDRLTMTTFFADNDQDGFGDPSTLVQGCDAGGTRSLNELDCDDTDDSVGPDSSCAPFDGVWTGAVDFEVSAVYGYSGDCTDTGSVLISDQSSTQVSGTVVCNWYGSGYTYMPVNVTLVGSIDYPWGVSGYFTDQNDWFYVDDWQTEFTGEFSEDGSTLVLELAAARDDLFGSYDVSLEGTWTLEP
ncbi:putative metal-binding motif-containing protein [Myxococcota bacterium]|nr:putative metal-binding motif-containing protein [Myxococcota bacterium]